MANIVSQLRSGKADVHHRGTDLKDVEFPSYIVKAAEVAYDEDKLVETLKNEGILLNMLHLGMSEYVVKWRANVRPSDNSEKPKEILDEETDARERGRTFVPSLLPNPDEVKTSKSTSKALDEAGRKMAISFAQAKVPWDSAAGIMRGAGFKAEKYQDIYERALLG